MTILSSYREPKSTRQSDFVRLAARWDADIMVIGDIDAEGPGTSNA